MGREDLGRLSGAGRAESRPWRWREAKRMKTSPADQKHQSKEWEAEMARRVGRVLRQRPACWGRRGSGAGLRAGWAAPAVLLGAIPPRVFLTHTPETLLCLCPRS